MQAPDSVLIDRALGLLLEKLQAEHELDALRAEPYEDDDDLAWDAPPGPELPYDGDVPAEVLALAEQRRRAS